MGGLQFFVSNLKSACWAHTEVDEDAECHYDDGSDDDDAEALLPGAFLGLLHLELVDMELGAHLGQLVFGVVGVYRVADIIYVEVHLCSLAVATQVLKDFSTLFANADYLRRIALFVELL